jgi:amino-acid N-acetyltransferase
MLDVAILWSLNIRVVLVHGASAQIKSLAEGRQVRASDFDGTGVTDAVTLDLALIAANRLTHEILEGLSANDLRAANANVIVAHPVGILQGVDHLFTGRSARRCRSAPLLEQGSCQSSPARLRRRRNGLCLNSDGVALAPNS